MKKAKIFTGSMITLIVSAVIGVSVYATESAEFRIHASKWDNNQIEFVTVGVPTEFEWSGGTGATVGITMNGDSTMYYNVEDNLSAVPFICGSMYETQYKSRIDVAVDERFYRWPDIEPKIKKHSIHLGLGDRF